jgi:hypothetical protein
VYKMFFLGGGEYKIGFEFHLKQRIYCGNMDQINVTEQLLSRFSNIEFH